MRTLTVEIDDDKDIDGLKAYLTKSGYRFEVGENGTSEYSDEFKSMLDKRYDDYLDGKMPVISADESKRRINSLLNNA